LVGIGSVAAAQQFAQDLGLLDENYKDKIQLLADETGQVSDALCCYKGWLAVDRQHKERYPQSDINPYLKLLGMIFGLGSPGTIPKVVQGYVGDWKAEKGPEGRTWVVQSLLQGASQGRFPQLQASAFGVVDDDDDDRTSKESSSSSALRPFELATLRLQTGLHIVSKWPSLGPANGDLVTRMGGTFVFSNTSRNDDNKKKKECVWNFFDQGILCYANMDDICQVAEAAATKGERYYIPATNPREVREERARWREERREMEAAEQVVRKAEEARLKKQEEARIKALAEEEEEARLKVEEEARLKAEEEAKALEEARLKAVKEARLKAQFNATIRANEDVRAKAEEEARQKAEEEARWIAQEETRILAEEEAKILTVTPAQIVEAAEETGQKAQEEARRKEAFQRKLLGTRLRLEQPASSADRSKAESVEATAEESSNEASSSGPVLTQSTNHKLEAEGQGAKSVESFQRKLLQARLEYEQRVPSNQTNECHRSWNPLFDCTTGGGSSATTSTGFYLANY
jgi:hypothetical protein